MDYPEPACPLDPASVTGKPDSKPTGTAADIPALIARLDAYYGKEDYSSAESLLIEEKENVRSRGDWRSLLSILSEELGLYRKTMNEKEALRAVEESCALIEGHRMGRTVSGATVLLNAATTLKCFGKTADSEKIFEHVSRVYADNLDPSDYRFAGLYNNMALTFVDLGKFQQAEQYYHMALNVLERCENSQCDEAITWCNLAECYERQDSEDERISKCMEKAGDCLLSLDVRLDGYYTFAVSKCLPAFDRFGFFWYSAQLKKRLEQHNGISG